MRPANWIVSYPRSGNAFARALIANYFSGLDRPLRLDEIVQFTCGEHDESLLLGLTGKTPSNRTLEEEWGARPAYFERLREMTNHHMPLIKSHTVPGLIFDRPAFEFIAGDRVVHLVRHPCDVAISCKHFYNIDLAEAIRRLLTPGFYVGDPPNRGYEVIGSWAQHTRRWMQVTDTPVHQVIYFQLVAKPVEILMGIVGFLGVEPDRTRAEIAVEFSNFNRQRSEEKANGFAEASNTSQSPYFREGRPNQWLNVLTVEQAHVILDHDPELIEHFGFTKISVPR